MENAVEALKTAAAVLIFVIAISVTFSMFSKARATTDAIVTMQDKQKYLETADVDGGILYLSSDAVEGGSIETMTENGDRVVTADDVISTIYRYNIEKYGVTIIKNDGTVLARFDSNTENIMRQWYNITDAAAKENYADRIKQNLNNSYINSVDIDLDANRLAELYYIDVTGNTAIHAGAPWYGNQREIVKRCNADISGKRYELNMQSYNDNPTYKKDLFTLLNDPSKRIIEVVNEIDTSKYLSDGGAETNLLQEYQLPTIEIIYIIE